MYKSGCFKRWVLSAKNAQNPSLIILPLLLEWGRGDDFYATFFKSCILQLYSNVALSDLTGVALFILSFGLKCRQSVLFGSPEISAAFSSLQHPSL
jgi:hypothetical protein